MAAQLGVPGHVPGRAPAQRARQAVVETAQAGHDGGQRPLVEPDLGVGQVAVVEQQQVGLAYADQLGDLGGLALDVHLDRGTPHQVAVDLVVQADAEAVATQRRVLDGGGLLDPEGGVGALGVGLRARGQRVHAAGLQPLLGPGVQLAARRGLQRAEQVAELGVPEGVRLEVGAQPDQEVVHPDPGHQLLEHRGALGVGDAVEVDLDGLEVVVVGRDRVRAGELVLAQRPVLAGVGEAGPRLVELGRLDRRVVAGPLGEGLVEPEVVPPAHRDEVAEPHVGHLVEDHRGAELVERGVLAAAREVLVAQRHRAGVLHRAHVVLRHVELVVLAERVGVVEGLLEEGEALAGELDQLGGVHVLDQRLPAVVAQRDVAVLAAVGVVLDVVLAGDDRRDVGRHRLGRGEVPHRARPVERLGLRGRGVGDHHPVGRGGDVEGEAALEVRLLEGGVDAAGVGHLELAVGVHPVVGGVDEAVQPLAGAGVGHRRADDELVVGLEPGERDPVVGVHLGDVERGAVEDDLVDGRADEVGEGLGAGLGAAEPERGGRLEGGLAGGEVERDVVRRDLEEAGALLRLVAGEVGPRHGADHVTRDRRPGNHRAPGWVRPP